MPVASKNTVELVPELQEMFGYDACSGVVFWKKKPHGGRVGIGDVAGWVSKDGYVRIQYRRQMLLAHRVAWVIYFGEWPLDCIDHVNRVRSDNRIVNLREATHKENTRNAPVRSHSKLGLKGVQQLGSRFRARITCDGVRRNIGWFDTPEEAHAAYVTASKQMHGDFASA